MIIKGKPQKHTSFPKYLILGLAALSLSYSCYQYFKKEKNASLNSETEAFCGAEQVDGNLFVSGDLLLSGGLTQSSDKAYKGNYSSKINREQAYTMSLDYSDYASGDRIEASVWVHKLNSKYVYMVAQSENGFYEQTSEVTMSSGDWLLKKLQFNIPETSTSASLKIFVYTTIPVEGNTYVDNFQVVNKSKEEKNITNPLLQSSLAKLNFSVKAIEQLSSKRDEALTLGLLVKGDDDWVKAKFKPDGEEETEVKVRLKGDWTDHLQGDFWSYRVKMPSEKTWNRIATFSLQNPQTRANLMEWVYHQMLSSEDVLTPRYDLINLKVNNKTAKVYAYEEHFEKQIVEFKNRREGVIIRYDETEYWDAMRRDKESGSDYFSKLPQKQNQAEISPFAEKKIQNNEKLKEQYETACQLLRGFQIQQYKASQVFDIDRLAKFYAISEVMKAYHSTIWHNMRFYYNPVIKRLEPIGFDGFTPEGPYDFHKNAFYGAYRSSSFHDIDQHPDTALFRDEEFNKAYTSYLEKYSDEIFISNFLRGIEDVLESRERLIRTQVTDYQYDRQEVLQQGKNIQAALEIRNDLSVHAYTNNCDVKHCITSITNNHTLPLVYLGSSKTKKFLDQKKNALLYPNRRDNTKEYKSFKVPTDHKYVHYKLAGSEETYYSRIKPWSSPQAKINSDLLTPQLQLPDHTAILQDQSAIVFRKSNYDIAEPIIIPAGYKVVFEQGADLDFQNRSYFLSYSPVYINGSTDDLVTIRSSDKSSQGFHVLQAAKTSTLKHCAFQSLNTLEEGSWQMTGAVTFYESPVELSDVVISHNFCEDALNIIRTDFSAIRLHINNTFADGFDSDFCHGTLSDAMFVNTGNDGIDFSGSTVDISNIILKNIGDKGISAGEQATLKVKSAEIDQAVIGVASKDLSTVTIENISLRNCNKGFAAYQKKPEFGPGSIKVKVYQAEDVEFLQIAENKSVIELPETQ